MTSLDAAGPVLDARGRVLDRVVVRGLRAVGRHGVLAFERATGQPFGLDVALHLDTREAAAADDLGATVDYGALGERLVTLLTGEPVQLVETLADRAARTCLAASERVVAVDVVVHKPRAPLTVPFEDVELVVRRTRDDLP
ncbi:dihydroneopterin aldolase [Kineococcus sp. SYSU DK004]|uniref:dihydroneopterin aldolase n=1 Tax=Kineococcus sp. SYSU DK004 TaxID=3383125 RepID=UPI003D7CA0F3